MKKIIYYLLLFIFALVPLKVLAKSIESEKLSYDDQNYLLRQIQGINDNDATDNENDIINDNTDNDGTINDNNTNDDSIYNNTNNTTDNNVDEKVTDDDGDIFGLNSSFFIGLLIGIVGSYLIMLVTNRGRNTVNVKKDV